MKDLQRLNLRLLMVSVLLLITCLVYANLYRSKSISASVRNSNPERRVNVPDLGSGPFEPAVFWFGQVTPTINNADVRMWYYDEIMKLTLHIVDRRLWYDTTPSAATLADWDAVTIYMDQDGNSGTAPDKNSYRFVIQFGASKTDRRYQAAYRGNGTSWVTAPISFTAESIYRGEGGPNTNFDNKGWQLTIVIPFASLGLSGSPPTGTTWGLAFAVHDRDDASGSTIPDQIWPEMMVSAKPATWGQLHFGRAQYNPPDAIPTGTTTIRQGLNGASVVDGHVGGHTICGDGLDHWSEWGEANYAGYTQINIQNQWDISDYPCFSKYFVTFPLKSIPPGVVVISASLLMNMFGNAGGGPWGIPPDSYIQVFTVDKDWVEETLTWNNAPLALENIAGTWVKPVQSSDQRQYTWDVTKAVTEALKMGNPLRLALYSADGERHSGKYFWSSDSNDWDGTVRPTLRVTWGTVCDSQDTICHYTFLPFARN